MQRSLRARCEAAERDLRAAQSAVRRHQSGLQLMRRAAVGLGLASALQRGLDISLAAMYARWRWLAQSPATGLSPALATRSQWQHELVATAGGEPIARLLGSRGPAPLLATTDVGGASRR